METEAELKETGLSPFPLYHFDRHFAAGMVTTSSFIHSLICQSYFRPYILDLVSTLALKVVCINVEKDFVGKKYGNMLIKIVQMGMIPLGLYRKGKIWERQTNHQGGFGQSGMDVNAQLKMPYVYSNCKSEDIVGGEDMVFMIRHEALLR